jgi:uncharacterized membrane protein YcaP (DUF421 family)
MEAVFKAVALYFALLILFRIIAGRRTLGEMTIFDLLVLLIVGDIAQQFLVGDDASLVGVVLVIGTFLLIDVGLSLLKVRFRTLSNWLDGVPTVLCERGELDRHAMRKARVQEDDILAAAREFQGIGRLDQIGRATLETNGKISIIPVEKL